jgi:hypothetical protein
VVGGGVGVIPDIVCEWGLAGLRSAAAGRNVVIVDVFSFSTAVSVAVRRGAMILPCQWNEARAAALARAEGAELASKERPRTVHAGARVPWLDTRGAASGRPVAERFGNRVCRARSRREEHRRRVSAKRGGSGEMAR